MQWKIPFKEYFQSEPSKIGQISSEYRPTADQLTANNTPLALTTNELSAEQMAVINRFPSIVDTIDQSWLKYRQLVDDWKNKAEIWPLAHQMKVFLVANGLSGVYLTHRFRRAFGLADGRTALLNCYVPAVLVPMFFGSIIHYRLITAPMLTGIEDCQTCRCVNAGLIQAVSSTVYPLIFSSISSIYYAYYFNTFPTPESINDHISRKYLYDILWKALKRNRNGFVAIGVLNFMLAFYLTHKEKDTIEFMYISLLEQEFLKTKRKFN